MSDKIIISASGHGYTEEAGTHWDEMTEKERDDWRPFRPEFISVRSFLAAHAEVECHQPAAGSVPAIEERPRKGI
jgi:hypothetical protein